MKNKNKKNSPEYNSVRRATNSAPAFCVVDTTDYKGKPETRCMVQAKQAEYFMAQDEMAASVGPAPLYRDERGYLCSENMVPLHILNQARGIRPTYVVNGRTINPERYVYVGDKFFDLFTSWHEGQHGKPTSFRDESKMEAKTGNMVSMGDAIRSRGMG